VDGFSSSKHDIAEFRIIIKKCKALFTHYCVNSGVDFVRTQIILSSNYVNPSWVWLHDFVCFEFTSLCGVFLFSALVRCLFDSGSKISFEQVHNQLMILASSTLLIRKHKYSEDLNIIIFIGIDTLSFYAINMDDVSLFANSSFLFVASLNLYCIDILYQFE